MSILQSRSQTAAQGIGKPVPRKEDERLLQGKGCYGDDFNLSGQAYMVVVRSLITSRCTLGGSQVRSCGRIA